MLRFVLPVRSLTAGKSRLQMAEPSTPELITAMLADSIAAALGSALGEVVVATADRNVADVVTALGAEVWMTDSGLNGAIREARGPGRCAALLPDVPAATSAEIRRVLSEHERGFVPDRAGTGTTMAFDQALEPRFGPGSAARFEAAGLTRVDMPGSGLSIDVDTAADLAAARRAGLGEHTLRLLQSRGAGSP